MKPSNLVNLSSSRCTMWKPPWQKRKRKKGLGVGAEEARLRAAPLAGSREWTLTLASERRMFAVRLWNVVQVLLSIVLAVARRKAAQLLRWCSQRQRLPYGQRVVLPWWMRAMCDRSVIAVRSQLCKISEPQREMSPAETSLPVPTAREAIGRPLQAAQSWTYHCLSSAATVQS